MSISRRSILCDDNTIHDIDAPRQTHPVTKAIDPEALPGIEMAVARDLRASQKRDDPYLVCFDEPYDAEKYGKRWTLNHLVLKLTSIPPLKSKGLVHSQEMDGHRRPLRHRFQSYNGFDNHGSCSEHDRS
jgi:hypothetical protein